jgi:hypothetical protein
MLERYEGKLSRTVLRRGGGSNLSFLFGFKRDLFEMINYDIRHMLFLEDRNAAKAMRLVQTVKVISGMGSEAQMSVSLAYPTMNI